MRDEVLEISASAEFELRQKNEDLEYMTDKYEKLSQRYESQKKKFHKETDAIR